VDLDSQFLWNLAKFILIYFPMRKITQNLITFVPLVQKFQNNKHRASRALPHDTENKMRGQGLKIGRG
jgi:hypothetical protein